MSDYTLYLVTFDRGDHPVTGKVQPYHWVYFIEEGFQGIANPGIAYQLRGMPGGFSYGGPEKVDLSEFGRVRHKLEIGRVPVSKVDRVHEILSQVRVDTSESSGWNCQDWALDGLDELKKEGFVYGHHNKDGLKNWLKET
jgi:hypothetical protein